MKFAVPKIAQVIAASIRMKIVRRELKVGDNLPPEAQLAEIHGVSRPTIREVLRLLEGERLVSVRRGGRSGAIVMAPDIEFNAHSLATILQFQGTSVGDVWSAWTSIECMAIDTLARKPREKDLSSLRSISKSIRNSTNSPELFTDFGIEFSNNLVKLSGNETMLVIFKMLRNIAVAEIRAVRRHLDPSEQGWRREGMPDFIDRILDMIEEGNLAAAGLWKEQLDEVATFFLEIIGSATIVDVMSLE